MSGDDAPMTGGEGRVGYCAILGLPNVGKSTLLNQILGMRLVAVSSKPQTTRNRILGVKHIDATDDESAAQIIFFDTPGMQSGRSALRRFMRDEALAAAAESDVALLLIDVLDPRQRSPDGLAESDATAIRDALAGTRGVRGSPPPMTGVAPGSPGSGTRGVRGSPPPMTGVAPGSPGSGTRVPIVLAANKIDRLPDKRQLLPILEAYAATGRYDEIVPISAKQSDGIDRLLREIARRLPMGPVLFPEDMVTDRAERFLAAELIREQLFVQLGKEIPYATAVVVESFEERPEKGDVVIAAVIHVERDTQKRIVVGKNGARIKQVGERSREAISQLLACPVHVKLFVKVSRNWSRGQRGIRDMGYE